MEVGTPPLFKDGKGIIAQVENAPSSNLTSQLEPLPQLSSISQVTQTNINTVRVLLEGEIVAPTRAMALIYTIDTTVVNYQETVDFGKDVVVSLVINSLVRSRRKS